MKRSITILLALFLLSSLSLEADQQVAVAAGGYLTVYSASSTGQLQQKQQIGLNGRSGPFGISKDGRFLYINTGLPGEQNKRKLQPAIATFSIEADGSLKHQHTAASSWSTGYLRPDASGSFLAGNSYGAGKAGLWQLADDRVYRGAAPFEIELEKRAHSAVFSPDNRFLFVPATGPNKVFQLVFDAAQGTLAPHAPPFAPGPPELTARQPRHLIFHPTIPFAYTTNERELPGAGAWKYDQANGHLQSIQSVESMTDNSDGMTTADLHLSKDGKFLYVSNRDIKNQKQPTGRDSIALFSVNLDDGHLKHIKNFPSERVPRSFAIGLEGKFLFVSGQGDNTLGVYQTDPATGHLTAGAKYELPGKPSWVGVYAKP